MEHGAPLEAITPSHSKSLWIATSDKTDYRPLSEDIEVETAVIGGGIVGLTTALFSPSRMKPGATLKALVKEGPDIAKRLITEHKTMPSATLPEQLEPGEAKVLKVRGKEMAAYRDSEGKVHMIPAACPHMGCMMHWNDAELTWDCPCHGSRFTYNGRLIHGPSLIDLAEAAE